MSCSLISPIILFSLSSITGTTDIGDFPPSIISRASPKDVLGCTVCGDLHIISSAIRSLRSSTSFRERLRSPSVIMPTNLEFLITQEAPRGFSVICGRLAVGGRDMNPAGMEFQMRRLKPPFKMIRNADYAANFDDFLAQVKKDQPFCFWLGTSEPHRGYEVGAGKRTGKDPTKVIVPKIFPDHPVVRNDILDYYVEIEHFDKMVARALNSLDKAGQTDNTIVVVTSDHGMPFPRAKASLHDQGTRVPLAIRWPKGIREPGRVFSGLVNLSDLAPTFLEAAGLAVPKMMNANSLHDIIEKQPNTTRLTAFIAMERHDGCRKGGKGYPSRAIRTKDHMYILNHMPDRWPAGNPDREFCARYIPFGEVDSSPTKTLLMDNRNKPEFQRFYDLAFAKRPAEELYDLKKDPGQINNLAGKPHYAKIQKKLSVQLQQRLKNTKDPRALGLDVPWDYYPYYGAMRNKNWAVDPKP